MTEIFIRVCRPYSNMEKREFCKCICNHHRIVKSVVPDIQSSQAFAVGKCSVLFRVLSDFLHFAKNFQMGL